MDPVRLLHDSRRRRLTDLLAQRSVSLDPTQQSSLGLLSLVDNGIVIAIGSLASSERSAAQTLLSLVNPSSPLTESMLLTFRTKFRLLLGKEAKVQSNRGDLDAFYSTPVELDGFRPRGEEEESPRKSSEHKVSSFTETEIFTTGRFQVAQQFRMRLQRKQHEWRKQLRQTRRSRDKLKSKVNALQAQVRDLEELSLISVLRKFRRQRV